MRTLSVVLALACAGTAALAPAPGRAQASLDERALEPLQQLPATAAPATAAPATAAPATAAPAGAAPVTPAPPPSEPTRPASPPRTPPAHSSPAHRPHAAPSHPAPSRPSAPHAATPPASGTPSPSPPAASAIAHPATPPAKPPTPPAPTSAAQIRVPLAPPPAPVLPPALVVPTRPPAPPAPAQIAADAPGDATPVKDGLRVTFGDGRADLNPGTASALRQLAHGAAAESRFTVSAFAPGAPEDPSTPRRLSLSRALAVRSLLIAEGVASVRIYVKALGASQGVAEGPADRVDVTLAAPTAASQPAASQAGSPP